MAIRSRRRPAGLRAADRGHRGCGSGRRDDDGAEGLVHPPDNPLVGALGFHVVEEVDCVVGDGDAGHRGLSVVVVVDLGLGFVFF